MSRSDRDLKLAPPYGQLLPPCIALWVGIITSTAGSSWPVLFAVLAALVTTSVMFLRRSALHLAAAACTGFIALLYLSFVALSQIAHRAINAGGLIGESLLGALFMVLPWHHEPSRRNGFWFVMSLFGAFVLGTAIGHSVRMWSVGSSTPAYTALTLQNVSPDNSSIIHDPRILVSIVTFLSFGFVFASLLIVLFDQQDSRTPSKSADSLSRSPALSSFLTLIGDLVASATRLWDRASFRSTSRLQSENFFAMLYLMLDSNGRLEPEEARILDETMDRYLYHYSNARRITVMQSMRRARASGRPFSSFAQAFVSEAAGNTGALSTAFDCLVVAAGCDGSIDHSQMRMLTEASRAFGFPASRVQDTIDRFHDTLGEEGDEQERERSEQQSGQQTEHEYYSAAAGEERSGLAWAYQKLGCAPGEHGRVVKKRYREAVRTLHPDSFAANRVTPREAQELAKRFLEVQRAYEELNKAGVV